MIICLKLKEKIGSICSRFQNFDQQDSREFLTYLLDGLHEELKFVTENSTNFDEILIKSPEAFQVSLLFFIFIKDSYFFASEKFKSLNLLLIGEMCYHNFNFIKK